MATNVSLPGEIRGWAFLLVVVGFVVIDMTAYVLFSRAMAPSTSQSATVEQRLRNVDQRFSDMEQRLNQLDGRASAAATLAAKAQETATTAKNLTVSRSELQRIIRRCVKGKSCSEPNPCKP